MTYLNEKTLLQLKQFEPVFSTATYHQYKRGTFREDDLKMGEIYEKATGDKLQPWNCSICSLKNYAKVGRIYFESLKYLNEQKQNQDKSTADKPKKQTKKSKK